MFSKKKFIETIFKELKNNKNIVSSTFVGSFVDKKSINKINDIDLIIILKKLNKRKFQETINSINNLNLSNFFKTKNIYINNSFGPLKFKTKNNVVIHLMIYDIEGHISHAYNSPFTVYDWERSDVFYGKKMSDICSVKTLQLIDFYRARRGTLNYLNDIVKASISYREYKFTKKKYKIILKKFLLTKKDKSEFYYHVVKNLILNFKKFIKNRNKLYTFSNTNLDIQSFFNDQFVTKYKNGIYEIIKNKKKLNKKVLPRQDKWVKMFVKDFNKYIISLNKSSKKITFVRHQKTPLNNNTFLGQSRDPSIINFNPDNITNYSNVYSSPMLRSIQTAKKLSKGKKITIVSNLNEINYGFAEGLTIENLKKKYPLVITNWKKGVDYPFPDGETQSDVLKRLKKFINIIKNENSLVVTHNVVLRCLIGHFFNIPKYNWFKIKIPHLMNLQFISIENRIYPNIDRDKLKIIFENLN